MDKTTVNDDFLKFFRLIRKKDVTGVSGTGVVAYVVKVDPKHIFVKWEPTPSIPNSYNGITVYPCMEAVEAVHGHNGSTVIEPMTDDDVYKLFQFEFGTEVTKIVFPHGACLELFSPEFKFGSLYYSFSPGSDEQ